MHKSERLQNCVAELPPFLLSAHTHTHSHTLFFLLASRNTEEEREEITYLLTMIF